MTRYCCISGSRADLAAMIPVANAVDAQWAYVDTLPSREPADSAVSCGEAMMMAADQLKRIKPDLVILAGDRFEILGAATTAHLMHIPIAHLSGGDITEGSQDDAMRHAITKLAALHFPTNQESADRLEAMGEETWRIHMVGAPQIDYLLAMPLYSKEETKTLLGFRFPKIFDQAYILVAYQPPTGLENPTQEIDGLLEILGKTNLKCIFTTVNTDAGGIEISRKIAQFCRSTGTHAIVKMDHKLYLSAMKHCEYMIGNSSSGYYEAPTLGTKFVAIGDRQKGRRAMRGDGKASERIRLTLDAMMMVPKPVLLQKKWSTQCHSTLPGRKSTTNADGAATPKKSLFGGLHEPFPFQQGCLTSDQGKGHLLGF